jgi:hypothetical protein
MPHRPIFALLIMTLLSFPVALLAQEVVQTQKFNYPPASSSKFTIDDTNGTIAIRCSDRNEVEITATKHPDSQADLDAIHIDIKQGTGTIEVQTVYSSPGLIMVEFPIKSRCWRESRSKTRCRIPSFGSKDHKRHY